MKAGDTCFASVKGREKDGFRYWSKGIVIEETPGKVLVSFWSPFGTCEAEVTRDHIIVIDDSDSALSISNKIDRLKTQI